MTLPSSGMAPFLAQIEGGVDGSFYDEIKDFFYFTQLRRCCSPPFFYSIPGGCCVLPPASSHSRLRQQTLPTSSHTRPRRRSRNMPPSFQSRRGVDGGAAHRWHGAAAPGAGPHARSGLLPDKPPGGHPIRSALHFEAGMQTAPRRAPQPLPPTKFAVLMFCRLRICSLR